MGVRTIILSAALLAGLGFPSDSSAVGPTLAQQQAPSLEHDQITVEERLDRIEAQIHMILQHLGLSLSRPAYDSQGGVAEPAVPGGRIPRLEEDTRNINHQITAIQREIDEITKPGASVSVRGKLVLHNLTGVSQDVSINGIRLRIRAGRTETWVPHAIVEVYLPWFESPKLWGMSNWRWTGHHHEMVISIRRLQ